jgi:tetratricopeptide (TPR) repeat protein
MKHIFLFFVLITGANSFAQYVDPNDAKKIRQDSIINDYLTNGAERINYNIQMTEWQQCLDEGLAKDPTVAYLWQQKAMPYFKARKYEVGMQYIDKAVKYDAERWQPYRAFIKCIFAKTYRDALVDFKVCKKKYGDNYVMDHSFGFYMGLCHLQLNEYAKAETLFEAYNKDIFANRQGLEHPTALFYLGIAKFELKKWSEAIACFDKALKLDASFSDAIFYKAVCQYRTGTPLEEVKLLFKEAKEASLGGHTLNEDNVMYEMYPYQKKWK